ncbi:MAG: HAMP domain-containing protein [Deltaproteobacteria bacterium]|nr:HAMP domain-containing protein [Deltaproteobacteria bacterium]
MIAPLTRARETIAQSGRLLLFYVVLNSVVLFLFGALWLVRAVVRPLEALARTTEKLAAGEIEGLPPLAGTNEIQRLHAATGALVTSLKARREKLLEAERLAALGVFASGIAHEVGNPLAAVIGYIEILARGGRADGERDEWYARSLTELRRIDRFLRDLLEYARPRATAPRAVDVASVVEEALRSFEGQPRAEGVDFTRDPREAREHRALAEPERLRDVVVNLVTNALDALADVTRQRRVAVRISHDGAGQVVLEVSDNGPGIPADVRARIFEPFFSTKGPGKGTGLGLAIVKASVAAWGGRVEVDDAPGGGTRVRVFLNADLDGQRRDAIR